jgi:hypothetical protein
MVGLNIPKSFSDPFQGWSEERKRFFHQYGYDRGPGVISPGEGFRSPVGQPKVRQVIKETDDDKPNVRTTTIDYPDQAPTGSPWGQRLGEDALSFQDYGSALTGLLTPESPAPGVQFDEYAPRRGEGGMADFDERGMQQYWQDVARREQRQPIGGTGVQYEGGDETDNIMYAIKIAESGGDPLAHNPGTPENPEDSIGGFQINWDFWGQGDGYDIINNATKPILGRDLQREDLFNEQVNDAAGYAIQASEGYGPWSTYNDGTYLQHLAQAEDPNLLQRAGSGIVEGIKSAWGEPTTQSGVGFDKPPHTAETPDYTREDAPEGIPQEIYNQLRDNHHFGQQLGITSEPTQDTSLLAGAGPSDAELAEAQARMTNPALAGMQQKGIDYYAAEPEVAADTSLLAGAGEEFDARAQLESLLAGEDQVVSIGDDGQEITMSDLLERQMYGGVGRLMGLPRAILKKLTPAQLKALKQYTPKGGKRLKRDAEQWKRFDELLRNPPKPGLTGKQKIASTIAGVVGADLLIDREDLENAPWPIQKAADAAIELKTAVEEKTAAAARRMGKYVGIPGGSLWENPEEHAFREKIEAAYPGTELGEYGRAGIEEETFAPPPIGLLEETKPIEVAEMTQADLHDKMIKDWTPYKDAVAEMNASDIKKTAGESLDKGLNRIWANFPSDVEGRRDRYLQALGEIYKKVAILNVIAALTNSPSMAPQFMELAAKRFETLEGFKGEERLRDIAKGVYFTQDGKFDAPKSKQEAYERAMQFGASAKEAATISGYMVDEEDEDQYYRDDGKGGWETMRSDTDPRGDWTRGNPSGKPPSAATTAAGTALTRNIASYQGHLDAATAAEEAGDTDLASEHRAIADIYYRHLNKEGTKESRSDLFDRLYDYYWDANKGLSGLKTGSPDFKDWLLGIGTKDKQGIFHAKMHLGSNYADVIQGSAAEMEEVRVEGGRELPLADAPATRKEAEKLLRAENPYKDYPDLTKEQYETRIKQILDEAGY